jgi:hypothetical protein
MNFLKTKLFFFIGFIAVAAIFTGCVKGDFDEPPINIPTVDFEANTTIAQLKASYTEFSILLVTTLSSKE